MTVYVDSREPKHIVRFFKKKGWTVKHEKFAEAGDIADDDLPEEPNQAEDDETDNDVNFSDANSLDANSLEEE